MNIQEAIKGGKPFRRKGWFDNAIYVVYHKNDIALTLETDFSTSIELDVQDILADDWYARDGSVARSDPRTDDPTELPWHPQTM